MKLIYVAKSSVYAKDRVLYYANVLGLYSSQDEAESCVDREIRRFIKEMSSDNLVAGLILNAWVEYTYIADEGEGGDEISGANVDNMTYLQTTHLKTFKSVGGEII
jgi:hypothetical protein